MVSETWGMSHPDGALRATINDDIENMEHIQCIYLNTKPTRNSSARSGLPDLQKEDDNGRQVADIASQPKYVHRECRAIIKCRPT